MHPPSPPHRPAHPAPAGAAVAAVVLGNVALAFGPWLVRLADTGPVAAGFWRMALGLPFVAALAWRVDGRSGGRAGGGPGLFGSGRFWLLVLGGVTFAADLGSWHLGIRRTTLANATLFGNTATLLFPLYGFAVARRWPTPMQGLALAMATAGAVLLMGRSFHVDPRRLTGDLLCLVAGVFYTVYFIALSRVRTTMPPLSALTLSTAASVLPLLAFAALLGERIWPHGWGPLVALALASQVFGQGCMVYALGKLSPLVVGLALLIQPVVAATVGWLAYDERLGAPDLFGAALIAVALVLVARAKAADAPAAPHVEEEQA